MLPAPLILLPFCLIHFLRLLAFPPTLIIVLHLRLHPSILPIAVIRLDQAGDILLGATLGHQ